MAVANLRFLRVAPRKMRIIANIIRGKDVTSAINILRFMKKSGAPEFFKLLVSAVANAEDKGGVDIDNLVVSAVQVNQGPTHRRWRPRAMGRGTRVEKKTSHVTIELGAAQEQAS